MSARISEVDTGGNEGQRQCRLCKANLEQKRKWGKYCNLEHKRIFEKKAREIGAKILEMVLEGNAWIS